MTDSKSTPIPAELADSWDLQVETLRGRLYEQRKVLHKTMGARPFQGKEVTLEQQMIEMGSLNLEGWSQIIQKHGRFKEDGQVLLPNAIIKQAKKLHKLSTQGEINL